MDPFTTDIPLILVTTLIITIIFLIFQQPRASSNLRNENVDGNSTSGHAQRIDNEDNDEEEFSSFLVIDVEATCISGKDFEWPNEIIEWPVVLLKWTTDTTKPNSKRLIAVDEFRSFVKPVLHPTLDPFCTQLTGITQAQVDKAPTFPDLLLQCEQFLMKNGLLNRKGRPIERFVWCSDGPWDLRDFLAKQLFISKIKKPRWIPDQVIDVRQAFSDWYLNTHLPKYNKGPPRHGSFSLRAPYKLETQLELLGLRFEGRQHSGIDDTRNVSRVLMELAGRGVRLRPNLDITASRRHYSWMGPGGEVTKNY
ncbi:hypothetical protein CPB86DRAFT_750730 [Serendipita vermifera]|nr:hypothetical protein CPB86DRAFT_750730 [Serendipita vermifera]